MAFKIKTLTGLVNVALHIKTAGGIVPMALHAKTTGGITRINVAGSLLSRMGFTTLLNARTNTIHPSVTASRAGPGMVQTEAGEWVWAKWPGQAVDANGKPISDATTTAHGGSFAPRRTCNPETGEYGFLVYKQTTNLYRYGSTNAVDNAAVTVQSYTVSMVGSGSVAISGAHSATLTGTGGNNRVSLTFTPTAGTLIITPAGSAQFVQLETGSIATPPVPTYGAQATCAADVYSWNNQILTDAGGTVVARSRGGETTGPSREVLSGNLGNVPLAIQYGGYISSWDGVNSTQATAGNYFSETGTAVSSWGVGKTITPGTYGPEVSTAYSGSITEVQMTFGNNGAESNPLQGTINHLSVSPTQRSAEERAQLAAITRF